jgi:hypothetical protein
MVNLLPEMILVPISLAEANTFVTEHYRHNASVLMAKFTVGCSCIGKIVGVAIVCRPVAQILDDGWTVVNRVCTDGTENANSFLYGAVRRAAWARGYKKLITYMLPSERGKIDTNPDPQCIRHDWPIRYASH